MNNETERKDIVHGLVESAKGKAEDQILRAYFTSVFEMSPLVDKFATWLLVVVGGTAALTITNIKIISSILPFTNIKIGLGFLLISGLFGFLEKFLALNIGTTVAQESKLRDILQKSSEEFHDKIRRYALLAEAADIDIGAAVDIGKPLDKFMEAHPWYIRLQLGKTITPENALKRRLRRYYRQLMYTTLEFIGFLIFVMITVFSI